MNRNLSAEEKSFLLWADLLDLSVDCFLAFRKKSIRGKDDYRELKKIFSRSSQEHLQSLYNILEKL